MSSGTTRQDMAATTLRLPADLHHSLRIYAHAKGMTVNEIVVKLIADFVTGPGRAEVISSLRSALASLGESDDDLYM